MNIPIFELERLQSVYENTVEINLTESGFHPYTLAELLSEDQLQHLSGITLGYGQTNGSPGLRKAIAALYPQTTADQILVTNGSAEANYIACKTLLEAGDELIMMIPNYMQISGIAESMGCKVLPFRLKSKDGWKPDLAELADQISPKTKMIAICNPNNPTGYTLTDSEKAEIVRLAAQVGAWIFSDEVYRGAELSGKEEISFLGLYDKVMVGGGLSKAYALPGLRLGWLAGPAHVVEHAWAYHDYTSITAGIMSHTIGEWVLAPQKRAEILTRNRKMLSNNLQLVQEWISQQQIDIHLIPPKAGGMAFCKYGLEMNSTEMCHWFRKEKNILILPGDCFGMDHYIRLGIGAHHSELFEGLKRLQEGFVNLR